jgi:hypothetical protein
MCTCCDARTTLYTWEAPVVMICGGALQNTKPVLIRGTHMLVVRSN